MLLPILHSIYAQSITDANALVYNFEENGSKYCKTKAKFNFRGHS